MSSLAAWLALLAYLAFAYTPWREALARLSRRLGDWSVAILLLPYLLATNLQPVPKDLLRYVAYLALPTLCLRWWARRARPFSLLQVTAILSIWIPVELDLFVLLCDLVTPGVNLRGLVSGFYLLPDTRAALLPGLQLPITTLTGLCLGLFLFTVRHPLKDVGLGFRLRRRDIRDAAIGLLAFGAVGAPLGLAIRFLRYNATIDRPQDVVVGILGGYLLVALPEEVIFRGLIQNLLIKRLRKVGVGLPVASLVFGLAHLNNATAGFPAPNWAYVLMATLAGLAYG